MIGVAVIGYGYWGPNLARCFAETDDCRLVAVADPSGAALARAARRHPGIRLVSDWRELLADPEIDAVAIATPVRTHFDIALAALQARRHVLVEKPMTETSSQARQLIAAADQGGLTLLVDHTFIYSSAVRKMRELVASGELGQVFYYDSTRINLGLFQSDVNVVWDLAVHDLSILQYVLESPPVAVSANGVRHVQGAPENMAQINLHLENGAVATLNVNWLAPLKVRRVLIGGSRKMIVWDDLEPSEKIKVYDRGVSLGVPAEPLHDLRVSYRIGDMWAPRLSLAEPIQAETTHFIRCIRGEETPVTGGPLGLQVVEMLEAIDRSIRLRGHPVDFSAQRIAS